MLFLDALLLHINVLLSPILLTELLELYRYQLFNREPLKTKIMNQLNTLNCTQDH